MEERIISSRRVFEGTIIAVRVDTVELEREGLPVQTKREVVEHRPAVVIVPIDETGFVLLVC